MNQDLADPLFSRRGPGGLRMKEVEMKDLSEFGQHLADTNPEWFPSGFKQLVAVDTPDFFAWYDDDGGYYLSTSDRQMPGFSPALELKKVLEKTNSPESLSFNGEYAIETLWHEMQHGKQKKFQQLNQVDSNLLEATTQFIARHTYHKLLELIGHTSTHQTEIIENGYAYPEVTRNWMWLLDRLGVDRRIAVNDLDLLLTQATTVSLRDDLAQWLADQSGKDKESLKRLFRAIGFQDIRDFAAKAAYIRE